MTTQIRALVEALEQGHGRFIEKEVAQFKRLTRFPATEPWWGKEKRYRFDDPLQQFGVTYVAEALEVAFAETILHEQTLFYDGRWVIDAPTIDARWVVYYRRPGNSAKLRLLDLTGASLKLLGLNNDLSSDHDYTLPQAVSRAVHEHVSDADGIYYVSRQLNTQYAAALFERSGVRCGANHLRLTDHPLYQQLLDTFNVAVLPRLAR